ISRALGRDSSRGLFTMGAPPPYPRPYPRIASRCSGRGPKRASPPCPLLHALALARHTRTRSFVSTHMAVDRNDVIRPWRLHTQEGSSDDLDRCGGLVAGGFDLVDAFDFAKTSLLLARFSKLVPESHDSSTHREMHHERERSSNHCKGPMNEEDA